MNCPHCAAVLSERGIFCQSCAGQARCKKCREQLEPGANACVECGTRLDQPLETPVAAGAHTSSSAAIQPNRNTLSYQEDRNSRRFEASLTDSAMHGLGDVFGELFARAGSARVAHINGHRSLTSEIVVDDTKQLPPAVPTNGEQQVTTSAPVVSQTPTDMVRVLKIFSVNGETLELRDNRLKATTAADYYRRLTYLFLYAHELHGRPSTPRTELVKILKDAKVFDPNCGAWLKQKKGFTVDAEDRLKLNAGAREQAVKVLDEAGDASVADQWNPDNRTVKPRGPKKKKA